MTMPTYLGRDDGEGESYTGRPGGRELHGTTGREREREREREGEREREIGGEGKNNA